jgi:hypothetical protein
MVVRVRVTLLLGRLNTLGVEASSDILVLRRSEVVQTDADSLRIYKAVDGTFDFFYLSRVSEVHCTRLL